jgi:hypothetical protein
MRAAFSHPYYRETALGQLDALTREWVVDALRGSPELDARDVAVHVASGEVTLTGCVETEGASALAERIADRVPGVMAVFNHLQLTAAYVDHGGDGHAQQNGYTPIAGLDSM